MSEATISNLIITAITAIVTIALAAIAAWKTAKMGAKEGAADALKPVAAQLLDNTAQLEVNSGKMDALHQQTNSALEDYKRVIRDESAKAIALAIQEGVAQGIELERTRREDIDKARILAEATAKAKIEEGKK